MLAGLCQRWEAVAAEKPDATRLVVLRIGIVLAADGGALGKMLPGCWWHPLDGGRWRQECNWLF